jgi:tRNA(adenine34) deaminase
MIDIHGIRPKNDHERYMIEALKEALKAYKAGEVPVGAVLVYEGRVISRGHNQVEMLKDATAHAEMLCITSGSSVKENWRLTDATLYCTVEPCSMCAGAMLLSRIEKLVWGAADLRHGANGSWVDLFSEDHPMHKIEVIKRVLEQESATLMRGFFQERRKLNKSERE